MLFWLLTISDKVTDIVSDKVESKSEKIDYAFVIVDDIPEFDISPTILELIRRLDSLRESCRSVANRRMESRLRRTSRLRSINSSLAIEGNDLDILRMRDVINGRTVRSNVNRKQRRLFDMFGLDPYKCPIGFETRKHVGIHGALSETSGPD